MPRPTAYACPQIEAPAVPLRAGQVWRITLDAAGGLNVKLVQNASGAPQ